MNRASAHFVSPGRLRSLALAGFTALALAAPGAPALAATPTPHVAPGDPVPPAAQSGKFVRTDLTRILDTRYKTGVPQSAPVHQNSTIRVNTGLNAADVKAVVMNVTVTGPSADGFVTVYPDGTDRPTTSNLNFTAGQTIPNLVTVPVTNGYVDFYNAAGDTDVIADLAGYYTDTTSIPGSSFVPVSPGRVLDTRAQSADFATLGANSSHTLKLAGRAGIPAAGATAVVLNVTATDTTSDSYLTLYPHGTTKPGTSNLNFTAGQTIPNLVTVALGADGSVDLYNQLGSTDVVVDVFGYYQSAPTGGAYHATGPKRMLDTRLPGGHALGQGETYNLPVATGGLGTTKISGVVLNVTATDASTDGYLTVFPGNGTKRPPTSNLNFTAGQTIPNLVIIPVDDSGLINIYNALGSTDVIVDIFGYFTDPTGGPTGTQLYPGSCSATAPGNWVSLSVGELLTTTARLDGTADFPNAASVWDQVVLTAPDGTTRNYTTDKLYPGPTNVQAQLPQPLKSGAYMWYAYTTDGTHVSAPSQPCYFRVDSDSAITGVTVTSDAVAGQIFMGQPITFTFKATSTGSTDGKTISGFCYSYNQAPGSCQQIPAVNGQASVTLNAGNWGTQILYVQAFTVSGWTAQATQYTYYVRWH